MAKVKDKGKKKEAQFGSDVIVDLMKALDIEYAAFNPGSTFRGIHDSILNYGGNRKPEVIFCFHEEYSVAIAHGYAKAAGKPMAAITHNVVGLQHASMAIYNAWCDRVPVIVMGGTGPMDTTRRRPGIDWVHTALVQGNQVRDYVKWDDQPHNLQSIPSSFIRAHRLAVTDPTAPVYLCFDAAIQEDPVPARIELPDLGRFSPPAPLPANPEALRLAAQLLVKAKSPLIIADYMGRHPTAVCSLVELAELLAIPVIDKGNRFNFPNTHPLDVTGGAIGLLEKADVILALDVNDLYGSLTTLNRTTRVSEYVTLPAAKIISISLKDLLVHSWGADYQPLQAVDVAISADTSLALPELTRLCRQLMGGKENAELRIEKRRQAVKAKHDVQRARWAEEARTKAGQKEISLAFLAQEIWEVIRKEDWVLVNGTARDWARRLWDWTMPHQYLGGSGGHGLGYGLSASIGAALAHRGTGKLCVDIQADGDFLMTASALWTAAHHKIPLLIVMHNNQSFYNSEEHGIQTARARNRPVAMAGIGTHVDNPPVDYVALAKGFGVAAEGPVRRTGDLRPALQRALEAVKKKKMPFLVDVISEPR